MPKLKWFDEKKKSGFTEKNGENDIFQGKAFRMVLINGQNYPLVNIPVVKKILDGQIK